MPNIDKQYVENFNKVLQEKEVAIACAESMTGGLLASTICSASGAMSVLKGSVVSYNNDMKSEVLKVSPRVIKQYSAESPETTDAMCEGLRQLYPFASLYVAITGIAEQTPECDIPEGQIYVTIWYGGNWYRYADVLLPEDKEDHRNAIRKQAVEYILDKILYIVTLPPVAGIVAPEM